MKLIIDIPDHVYEWVKNTGKFGMYRFDTAKAINNGTPLDSVKAEIDDEWANTHHMYPEYAGGLARASEIIDKHIGKAESED